VVDLEVQQQQQEDGLVVTRGRVNYMKCHLQCRWVAAALAR
jgi:hypothetical protein